MPHERWREIEELYHAVLERGRGVLADADAELRGEVESLLAQEGTLPELGTQTRTLVTPGVLLGPYRIEGPLGAGGMGEVHRGRDTRLGRPVAVKFLISDTAAGATTLERFRREAQAISALNHPNVCTIYDIGEQDGRPYLVMELLDGQTLKQRIATGGFSNEEILAIATPILEALEAAHAAGLVHRDIKPANIFLTKPLPNQSGVVKILDFGLAKTATGLPGPIPGEESLTAPGTTVGSVAYMAPEQARGDSVDGRADLFACGVVLYEMATGKRPFEGEGWATLAAVLSSTPRPPGELNRDLLPGIERIIGRALEKDPAARYQTAGEMRAELLRVKREMDEQRALPPQPASPLPGQRSPNYAPRYAAVALPILLLAAGIAWYVRSPRGPVTSPAEFVQLTNFSDYATAPALSPDGRMLAFFRGGAYFLGTGELYVKLLPNGESKQLTNGSARKYDPVFTPEGSRVAYTAQTLDERDNWDTWTVPVLGGSPTRLMANAAGLSFMGGGRVLFSEIMSGSVLHMGIVTSLESRAEEHEIYYPSHQRAMAHYSWPSPDRQSILVVEMDRTSAWQRCRVIPMDGRSAGAQVGPEGACTAAGWSPDGRWMYFNAERDGSTHLWRQRVPDGTPEQITFGPTEEEGLAVAPDGRSLIASIGARRSSVWMHDSSGDQAVSVEGSVSSPRLSPDGKRLYYLLAKNNSSGEKELWSRDLSSGKSDPVVTGLRITDFDISQDQARVAFSVRNEGNSQIFLAALDRGSPPRLVTKDGDLVNFGGGGLVFRQLGEKASYMAHIQMDGSGAERILDAPIIETVGISPDGDWVAATDAETFAVSIRDHLRRTICAGFCPTTWAHDGKYLYVTTNRGTTSAGRTLAVPMPRGFASLDLPRSGLDRASDEELAAMRAIAIREGAVSPGPDPQTYAFMRAEFQGNLFRIPLH